jgi:hypothetical protein
MRCSCSIALSRGIIKPCSDDLGRHGVGAVRLFTVLLPAVASAAHSSSCSLSYVLVWNSAGVAAVSLVCPVLPPTLSPHPCESLRIICFLVVYSIVSSGCEETLLLHAHVSAKLTLLLLLCARCPLLRSSSSCLMLMALATSIVYSRSFSAAGEAAQLLKSVLNQLSH